METIKKDLLKNNDLSKNLTNNIISYQHFKENRILAQAHAEKNAQEIIKRLSRI